MPIAEIMAVLADEVSDAKAVVSTALAGMISAEDDAVFQEHREHYEEQLQRIAKAAGVLSLQGLQAVTAFLGENLEVLRRDTLTPEVQAVMQKWPNLVLGYLRAPAEGVYNRELAELFQRQAWPRPMGGTEAITMERALADMPDDDDESINGPSRQTEAREEDVMLDPGADVNPILVDAFLTEGPAQAAQYSELIQRIARGDGYAAEVDEARRLIHALKGAANTVGIRAIASLSHHVEDILEYLAEKSRTPEGKLARLLVEVADTLETMFDYLLGTDEMPGNMMRVLQDVLDVANSMDRGDYRADAASAAGANARAAVAEADDAALDEVAADDDSLNSLIQADRARLEDGTSGEEWVQAPPDSDTAAAMLSEDEMMSDEELAALMSGLPDAPDLADHSDSETTDMPVSSATVEDDDAGADLAPEPAGTGSRTDKPAPGKPAIKVEPKIRVAARTIDSLLQLSGEMAISRAHVQERLQSAATVVSDLREHGSILWRRANDLEGLVTTQGIAAGKRQTLATTAGSGGSSSEFFDPLEMDQYSELHTQVHGFVETIADVQLLNTNLREALASVQTAVNQQALLNNEVHDLLMTSRMIPVATLEPRLQRAVRQAADMTRKQATLAISGNDVMLDDQMVNELIDPLQHMLRNAVDHGLESPQTRLQLGKPEAGSIHLKFARDGNYLVINCQDDGAGLDLFRIHATARDRGLVTDAEALNEEEVARLILKPGFSTRGEVTEVSGRGVGMDIVNTHVTRLKGSIQIHSEAGKGVRFVLRVPMSMGIAHCLLAEAQEQVLALPTENLERIVYGGVDHIQRIGGEWNYRDEMTTCPVYSLRELLGYGKDEYGREDDWRPVVVMNYRAEKAAIVVDGVYTGRDLVIKGMGNYLGQIPGVTGASILGDGRVVPILELSDMVDMQQGHGEKVVQFKSAVSQDRKKTSDSRSTKDVLVVDDSLSVRTALSLLLGADGYKVRTAIDGVEAVDEIAKQVPAAILVDLEMPRMNGLELTSYLRGNADTRDVPIIMITSRTSEKHRSQAKVAGVSYYLAKPYRDSDLLSLIKDTLKQAAA